MKKNTNILLSGILYIAAIAIYRIELFIFSNQFLHETSSTTYVGKLAYIMALPIILILLGIYFSFRARKSDRSPWAGVLILLGFIFLIAAVFLFAEGSLINASEAFLQSLYFFV